MEPDDGRLASDDYPDGLARLWSALRAPNAGDLLVSLTEGYECVDWGGVTHRAAPATAPWRPATRWARSSSAGWSVAGDAREQWALRDVAASCCSTLAFGTGPRKARRSALPRSAR